MRLIIVRNFWERKIFFEFIGFFSNYTRGINPFLSLVVFSPAVRTVQNNVKFVNSKIQKFKNCKFGSCSVKNGSLAEACRTELKNRTFGRSLYFGQIHSRIRMVIWNESLLERKVTIPCISQRRQFSTKTTKTDYTRVDR